MSNTLKLGKSDRMVSNPVQEYFCDNEAALDREYERGYSRGYDDAMAEARQVIAELRREYE